jgi:GAF domain-containing protein
MEETYLSQALINAERLRILDELALIGDGADSFELIYDRITNLTSIILRAPVVLVTLLTANEQFFKSYTGLPEPWKSKRRTPLSHSLCKHVVATNQPLIVEDARKVSFLKNNKAISELDVIAYMGVPVAINAAGGHHTLGSFCVIDDRARLWRDVEVEIAQQFAEIITQEIELKAKSQLDSRYEKALDSLHESINQLIDNIDTDLNHAQLLSQIKALRVEKL